MKIDYIVSGFSLIIGILSLGISLVFWKINHKKDCRPSHSMKEAASTKE